MLQQTERQSLLRAQTRLRVSRVLFIMKPQLFYLPLKSSNPGLSTYFPEILIFVRYIYVILRSSNS